jgi:ribosome maturation factor RimP
MTAAGRASWIEQVVRVAERAAEREGLEVWNVEVLGAGRQRVVRIFIDKPEGVTHADCELMSQQVGTVLDVEDIVPGQSYHLEVSSPGVERKLRHEGDFRRFAGQRARITLRDPLEGQRRFEGRICGVDEDGSILLETGAARSLRLRMDQIEKANLKFEW